MLLFKSLLQTTSDAAAEQHTRSMHLWAKSRRYSDESNQEMALVTDQLRRKTPMPRHVYPSKRRRSCLRRGHCILRECPVFPPNKVFACSLYRAVSLGSSVCIMQKQYMTALQSQYHHHARPNKNGLGLKCLWWIFEAYAQQPTAYVATCSGLSCLSKCSRCMSGKGNRYCCIFLSEVNALI